MTIALEQKDFPYKFLRSELLISYIFESFFDAGPIRKSYNRFEHVYSLKNLISQR